MNGYYHMVAFSSVCFLEVQKGEGVKEWRGERVRGSEGVK